MTQMLAGCMSPLVKNAAFPLSGADGKKQKFIEAVGRWGRTPADGRLQAGRYRTLRWRKRPFVPALD